MSLSLSPLIRFGTSTWSYEGGQGQVYKRQYTKSTFTRECLGEYCQYQYEGEPLLRTVGNDSTFYRKPATALVDPGLWCCGAAPLDAVEDANNLAITGAPVSGSYSV